MAQRDSGYERRERELYETPEWVTEAVLPHLRLLRTVLEPCVATGKMYRVLARYAEEAIGSDIKPAQGFPVADFLDVQQRPITPITDIVSNPPYGEDGELAVQFIEHALNITQDVRGQVAMLLRADFDHASSRQHIFRSHPAFAKRIVLTKRIKWFEGPVTCKHCNGHGSVPRDDGLCLVKCKPCRGKGKKNQSPSENHCWFIWDWQTVGRHPQVAYAP